MAAKTGSCAHKAAHRKAQNKYVKKNPAAQRARVKKSEAVHKTAVKARHAKAAKAAKQGKGHGSKTGRPRTC